MLSTVNWLTILLKAFATGELGKVDTTLCPVTPTLGSIGMAPRNGTDAYSANDFPPPDENMLEQVWKWK